MINDHGSSRSVNSCATAVFSSLSRSLIVVDTRNSLDISHYVVSLDRSVIIFA